MCEQSFSTNSEWLNLLRAVRTHDCLSDTCKIYLCTTQPKNRAYSETNNPENKCKGCRQMSSKGENMLWFGHSWIMMQWTFNFQTIATIVIQSLSPDYFCVSSLLSFTPLLTLTYRNETPGMRRASGVPHGCLCFKFTYALPQTAFQRFKKKKICI